jgi:hypothetical protein
VASTNHEEPKEPQAGDSTRRRGRSTNQRGTSQTYGSTALDKTSANFRSKLSAEACGRNGQRLYRDPPQLVRGLKGAELTNTYARVNGMSTPMIFEASERDALGIIMPTSESSTNERKKMSKFDPSDVARLAGPKRKLSVLSVAKQTGLRMSLEQWAEYWGSAEQRAAKGILNLITLECSGTALASRLRSPAFVREVDWIDKIWPAHDDASLATAGNKCGEESEAVGFKQKTGQKFRNSKGTGSTTHPKVQMYCLMSVEGSYTDFHVDFGGTSVWYHLLKGEKVTARLTSTTTSIPLPRSNSRLLLPPLPRLAPHPLSQVFLLAPPTPANFSSFSTWCSEDLFSTGAAPAEAAPPHTSSSLPTYPLCPPRTLLPVHSPLHPTPLLFPTVFLPEMMAPGSFSRVVLHAGETLIIPSGWIHAVLTPQVRTRNSTAENSSAISATDCCKSK